MKVIGGVILVLEEPITVDIVTKALEVFIADRERWSDPPEAEVSMARMMLRDVERWRS